MEKGGAPGKATDIDEFDRMISVWIDRVSREKGGKMRSKTAVIGFLTLLSVCVLFSSGVLMAGEGSDSKECPHVSKVEGKSGDSEMCKQMKDHKAAMSAAAEKMSEHLIAMKEISNEEEWREEMEVHMGMLQAYIEEVSKCPMEGMMHKMMHGEHGEQGHEGSETK